MPNLSKRPIFPHRLPRWSAFALFCLISPALVLSGCGRTLAGQPASTPPSPTATVAPSATPSPAPAPGATVYVVNDTSLYALSAVNGVPRWRASTSWGSFGQPIVANGVVYLLGNEGGGANASSLQAFRASDGAALWQYPLPDYSEQRYTLWNGTLYTMTDGELAPPHTFFAVDAQTGALRWRVDVVGLSAAAPIASDTTVYLACGGTLFAFDPRSGAPLWHVDLSRFDIVGTMALAGNVLYVSTEGGTIMALHANDGTAIWTVGPGAIVGNGFYLMLANGLLYAAPSLGFLHFYALDPATGATRWSYKADQQAAAPPIFVSGALYLRDFNSPVFALNADTGALLWSVPYSDDIGNGIAAGYGEVFVTSMYGSRGTLHALRASDGADIWTFSAASQFRTPQVGP